MFGFWSIYIVIQLYTRYMLPRLLCGIDMLLSGAKTAVCTFLNPTMFAFSPHVQEYPLLPHQEQHWRYFSAFTTFIIWSPDPLYIYKPMHMCLCGCAYTAWRVWTLDYIVQFLWLCCCLSQMLWEWQSYVTKWEVSVWMMILMCTCTCTYMYVCTYVDV